MTAPTPSLTYSFSYRCAPYPSGEGVVGDGPPLHRVFEVGACLLPRTGLYVSVRGQRLRRDGTPSSQQRGSTVDLDSPQPQWLEEVIEDARSRLLPADTQETHDA